MTSLEMILAGVGLAEIAAGAALMWWHGTIAEDQDDQAGRLDYRAARLDETQARITANAVRLTKREIALARREHLAGRTVNPDGAPGAFRRALDDALERRPLQLVDNTIEANCADTGDSAGRTEGERQ